MEREFLGKGRDHQVYRSSRSPEWVFKKPYGLMNATLAIGGKDKVAELRQELEAARQATDTTGIHVPETRIMRVNKGYVIAQKYIAEDHSVDVLNYLNDHNALVINHYDEKPTNFVSNQGKVYVIDPFKGILSRIAFSTHLINVSSLRKMLHKYRMLRSNMGLK